MRQVTAALVLLVATSTMGPAARARAAGCGPVDCAAFRRSLESALAGVACAPEPLATAAHDQLEDLVRDVDARVAARRDGHRHLVTSQQVSGGIDPFVYPGFGRRALRRARRTYCHLVLLADPTDLAPACRLTLAAPCPTAR